MQNSQEYPQEEQSLAYNQSQATYEVQDEEAEDEYNSDDNAPLIRNGLSGGGIKPCPEIFPYDSNQCLGKTKCYIHTILNLYCLLW